MTKSGASGGMKSALELAMERLRDKQGEIVPLTHEQKVEIANIEAETKAKVAEEEIMAQDRLRAAYAGGDAEAVRKLDEGIKAEIARIRERGERRKQEIREGR